MLKSAASAAAPDFDEAALPRPHYDAAELPSPWEQWCARTSDDLVERDLLRSLRTVIPTPHEASTVLVDAVTRHEWASNALELGDLDAEFRRVDVDGSGELEYPEFRAMLLTE